MDTLTEQEIADWEKKIDGLTRIEMARLWRFSPSGHPCFRSDLPLYERFKKRFEELGGFSPTISKAIGW